VKLALVRFYSTIEVSDRIKFSESAWKVLYYVFSSCWAMFVVFSQNYFWDTKLCWYDISIVPPTFKEFYLTQFSFYVHSIVALILMEVHRKDFSAMFFHHVVTMSLIGFSYGIGYVKIGGIVLALHDVNDVLLESGKLFVYLKWVTIANNIFKALLSCWIVTRILIYPIKVIHSTWVETYTVLDPKIQDDHWLMFNGFLIFLFILNIYWFSLMIKMLLRNDVKDIREKED